MSTAAAASASAVLVGLGFGFKHKLLGVRLSPSCFIETPFPYSVLFGYAYPAFECFKMVERRPGQIEQL